MALAFVGIGYLVYFIHHIATAIQASHILAAVAGETLRAVDRLFPEPLGEDPREELASGQYGDGHELRWHPALAKSSGYIQLVDDAALITFAREHHTVVRLERSIGEFVIQGAALASVEEHAATARDALEHLAGAFTIGRQRTVEQDAAYGIRQIVDVAVKALSPGINDSTTAVMCVDHLAAILTRVAGRHTPSPFRIQDGVLRVIARGPSYADLVDESFDQIRQHGGGNVAVLGRLIWAFQSLAQVAGGAGHRRVLLKHAEAVRETIHRTVPSPIDRQGLEAAVAGLADALGAEPQGRGR